MAATLAMLFAMGQGNVFYPLTLWSALAGLDRYLGGRRPVRGRRRRHVTGRRLSVAESPARKRCRTPSRTAGILAVINSAGSDAIRRRSARCQC